MGDLQVDPEACVGAEVPAKPEWEDADLGVRALLEAVRRLDGRLG